MQMGNFRTTEGQEKNIREQGNRDGHLDKHKCLHGTVDLVRAVLGHTNGSPSLMEVLSLSLAVITKHLLESLKIAAHLQLL